jgi:hypothetical protein
MKRLQPARYPLTIFPPVCMYSRMEWAMSLAAMLTWYVLGHCVDHCVEQLVASAQVSERQHSGRVHWKRGKSRSHESPCGQNVRYALPGRKKCSKSSKLHEPFDPLLLLLCELLELRHGTS